MLFIDEVHRFSKTQQDALLSAVENRVVLLVAATTENPSFSVVAPLLSRSLILQLRPLSADDIRTVVHRAIDDPRGLGGQITVAPEAVDLLVRLAAGDARRALGDWDENPRPRPVAATTYGPQLAPENPVTPPAN